MRIFLLSVVAVVLLAVGFIAFYDKPQAPVEITAHQMSDLISYERRVAGKTPVVFGGFLERSAQQSADRIKDVNIAAGGTLTITADANGNVIQKYGKAYAVGAEDAKAAIVQMMSDSTFREVLLREGINSMGVGIARSQDGQAFVLVLVGLLPTGL